MEILSYDKTPLKNVSVRQNGQYLEIWAHPTRIFVNEINLNTAKPEEVYAWLKLWTGLQQHDFELRIEYPAFHNLHPKGKLPLVLGEVRKPYVHVFE